MNATGGINLLYAWTKDNLRFPGVHYFPQSEEKDICVVAIHGMSGNILENYFASVLGETLANNGVGFLYGHNRGYNHINDIATREVGESKRGEESVGYKTVRIGATYERFTDCVFDIENWLEEARKLGYKRIVLLGHSLGCNKVIYYLHRNKPQDLMGVILASPPDMVGLAKLPKYQPNYDELLNEAKKNVSTGQPRKLLSILLWDWYQISSQTFLDLFEEGSPADNLPLLRNPDKFPELESITVPILGIMGEHDDIAIRTLKEDLDLIASKATSTTSFTKKFIPGANHTYDKSETELANTVLDWIKNLQG